VTTSSHLVKRGRRRRRKYRLFFGLFAGSSDLAV
jgi:hypothetical protein